MTASPGQTCAHIQLLGNNGSSGRYQCKVHSAWCLDHIKCQRHRVRATATASVTVMRKFCGRSSLLFLAVAVFRDWLLLRSEIVSGMCAKLRTVAASNNRDHPTRSLCYGLFAPHIYSFVLHAHPVRGESHYQRNTTGEVATGGMS